MTRALASSFALHLSTFIVAVLLCGGIEACHPQPRPPVPHTDASVTYCDFGDMGNAPVNADRCNTQVGGYPCIVCHGAQDCVDKTYQVYCEPTCVACGLAAVRR